GVRPAPTDLDAYRIDRLVGEVLDLATAAGYGGSHRFHLVGHDWGGQIAWTVAARHPDRIASLAVLSRPHPAAFLWAMRDNADGQQERSLHHRTFHDPATAARMLADDARRFRRALAAQGVPEPAIAEYLSVLGTDEALESALAWYRAAGGLSLELRPIAVPTLYLWGAEDATVARPAAWAAGESVTGPFRMEPIPGVGPFIPDQAPDAVTTLLLAPLAANAARASSSVP